MPFFPDFHEVVLPAGVPPQQPSNLRRAKEWGSALLDLHRTLRHPHPTPLRALPHTHTHRCVLPGVDGAAEIASRTVKRHAQQVAKGAADIASKEL